MQNSVTQRDATGKFVPQAAEKWLQRTQERAESHRQRVERLQADYGAWAAEKGITMAEIESMFA